MSALVKKHPAISLLVLAAISWLIARKLSLEAA
jgi:hypothetical protein